MHKIIAIALVNTANAKLIADVLKELGATTVAVASESNVEIPTTEEVIDSQEIPTTEDIATSSVTASEYRDLDADEIISEGDEWILKDQYRPNHGGTREWRTATAIGHRVGEFSKSKFRRRI